MNKSEVLETLAVADWSCAASSALIVAGDIWVKPLPPVVGTGLAPEGAAPPERSNGLVALWPKPVVCGDDVFAVVGKIR